MRSVPKLVDEYQKQVPFYRARLLVKPGWLVGRRSIMDMRQPSKKHSIKLEYDLYYIKHRTLINGFPASSCAPSARCYEADGSR
ncbi:MAG: hypothetical protein MZV64_24195 [Ignavibacteriales bacterium]|nr:hypothetical protein [Ignavibacteriales bacterium]